MKKMKKIETKVKGIGVYTPADALRAEAKRFECQARAIEVMLGRMIARPHWSTELAQKKG